MRVLLVDDDPLVREALMAVLESIGHTVRTAPDGDAALDELRDFPPELLVIDIIMPQREGVETIIEVRKTNPDLPIIAISGGGFIKGTALLEMASKLGATETLAKPFRTQQLIDAIARVTSS
jgi:two-component system, chemotaxis family, chemotaxis protein CheY